MLLAALVAVFMVYILGLRTQVMVAMEFTVVRPLVVLVVQA
jgi:hypothetical protein